MTAPPTATGDPFEGVRPLLFSIAYRMTGTRADAEDVLQEAFLRWQAADRAGIESPKAFLTTVVSRLSLDVLKAARRKREVYTGPWLPEPIVGPVNEPVELAESLSLAFLHVLESLPAEERVAFLMREVFDAAYSEVAGTLETSEANARQLVSRAREHLRSRRARKRVDPKAHQELLYRFLEACGDGDATALVGMLRDDAILYSDGGGKARAALNPIYGADRIIRFVLGLRRKDLGEWGGFGVEINGEPGAAVTLGGVVHSAITIELDEGRISAIYLVANPEKLGPLAQTPRKES
jgi:RNA polymerase sigma-70 factor (ECF subfamily)